MKGGTYLLVERYGLNEGILISIGQFSILWCQFEQYFFDSDAKQWKIIKWAENYPVDEVLLACCENVRSSSSTYLCDTGMLTITNRIYSESNQGNEETQKFIYNFLNRIDPETTLKGCMLYIQRIRDNLFHGLKAVYSLNDQKYMFDTINKFLNYILIKEGI